MAINFNLPVYFEDIKYEQEFIWIPIVSGSLFNTGMYLAEDATPSGSVLSTSAALADNDYSTVVVTGSTASGSMGIDLGTSRAVNTLTVYDDGTAGAGITGSGSYDSLQAFVSADNSSWSWVEDFYPLDRELYSGSVYQIPCVFNATQTYRYFKLYMDRGHIKSAVGNYLQFTEVRAWTQPSQVAISGSISTEYSVLTDDTINPILR